MAVKEWNDEAILNKIKRINRGNLGLACEYVRSAAASTSPTISGNLKGGFNSKVVSDEKGTIYNPVEYSPYVELGTNKQKAQYILTKALYNSKSAIKRILELQKK